jgi:hypothetical protein
VIQRRPFQAFHDDEETVLVFPDVVDDADVWMIEGRCRARFPLKSLARLGILGQFLGKEFQSNTPAEALVFRLIHDAHSATTQLAHNAVMRDCLVQHVAPMLGRGKKQVNFKTQEGSIHVLLGSGVIIIFPRACPSPRYRIASGTSLKL